MSVLGLLLVLASVALVLSRDVRVTVGVLAVQGAVLAATVVLGSAGSGTVAMYAGFTVVVKVLLIPGLLYALMRRWPAAVRQDQALPLWAYGAGLLVMLLGAHVTRILGPTHLISRPSLFFYALGAIGLGALMIVARRHLLSQVVALVAMENGLVVLELALAGSLPAFVEVGILVDLAIAVTLLAWLTRRIHQSLSTMDVAALRRLRG